MDAHLPDRHRIHVVGDPTIDWMVVVPSVVAPVALQSSYHWDASQPVQILSQPGGAALLHALLKQLAAAASPQAIDVSGPTIPDASRSDPTNDDLTRTYTIWQPHPSTIRGGEPVWRMHEFLGFHRGTRVLVSDAGPDEPIDCLVIDDANFGFRDEPTAWPTCLSGRIPIPLAQIILKMSNPLARGALWETLSRDHADHLTVYCSAGDLRKEYAPIGQALSWERMGSDIATAVRGRADLSVAARTIVSIGMSGAVLVERDGPATLIYDPLRQDGDWEREHPGIPVGLGTCVVAWLAMTASAEAEHPDWPAAIATGIDAGRTLHLLRRAGTLTGATADASPAFPLQTLARQMASPSSNAFRVVAVPDTDDWHIFSAVSTASYRAIAERIVVEGDALACRDMPVERVGAWSSIDRTEIESMRSVRNIIREYINQPRRVRPLSLAVFGPRGAGKSFAIKQMAREWMRGGTTLSVLEFNLSQFATPDDLPAALQRIRDCAVEGLLPLVFWDEFDTAAGGRELDWLARFLAPMQDGAFVENGIARPIGPAIFIFAGGTHPSMASFKQRAGEIPGAKATDFLSRLRGYVDILGPNMQSANDETFILRRALLLRALLIGKAPGLLRSGQLDIDPGVLRGFLDVTTYVHGARSMEAIVDMSSLIGKLRYERSALPPHHQLDLHVAAEEFLALVHGTS